MSRPRATAALVLVAALALLFGASALLMPAADAAVSRSVLTIADGAVFVSHDGSDFKAAREGDVIVAGDRLRADRGAAAELTYFEGSSVRIEANAEVIVESLPTPSGDPRETLGRAWHVVTSLIGGSCRYEVRTPSSTASVRG